ncbi:MAG: CBS and ACT domain-containing protein [Desulfobacteraceae bacterium]|nr:CBS and ACT domain-containing protein [Pseudomonadota bacterium]MBU4463779.1 CBS and ACT domain-containing protein [Pseudomonadota bacterium]MCG2755749.1 CBS and ACT domain-containing protein [Desulfobacteraceae bacterium]
MLVKNWMSKTVVTIEADDSIQAGMKLLKQHKIRMLPVTKKGKLVGVITDRDIKRASASDATTLSVHELNYILSKVKVKEIMSDRLITVPFDYTVEETAEVLLHNKISGVPVVDHDGKIVGTITQTDLFRVIITLTGVGEKGVQFAFQLKNRPGSIKAVADIIRGYDGRIVSILSSYERVPEGYHNVYIRMYGVERSKLPQLIEDLKAKVTLLYMVDHDENIREIY